MRSKREAMDPTKCIFGVLSIEKMTWDCRLRQRELKLLLLQKKKSRIHQHKALFFSSDCYNIVLLRTDVVEV